MHPNPAIENLIAEIEGFIDNGVIKKTLPFQTVNNDLDEINTLNSSEVPWEYFVVDPPIYGLFSKVAKSRDGRKSYYLELISSELGHADFQGIETLTNHIYDILKDRTVGRGKFNPTDFQKLMGGVEWLGKLWTHYDSGSVITLSMKNKIVYLFIIYSVGK